MKRTTFLSLAAVTALAACDGPNNPEGNETVAGVATGYGTNTNTAAPGTAPRIQTADEFVQVASAANRFEVEASRIALQKARSPEVKRYAQTMVEAHERAIADLKGIASAQQPPLEPKAMYNAQQTERLQALQSAQGGAAFDRRYLETQVEAHEAALRALRDYASGGEVTALKNYAVQKAPPLEGHLATARQMLAAMGG